MSAINNSKVANILGLEVRTDPEARDGNPYPHFAGIELELENVANAPAKMKKWKIVPDESLRNGLEFVTSSPISGAGLAAAIAEFYAADIKTKNSPRTSTHIHINVTDMKVSDLRAMFAISYMLEFALFRVLQADRKYCGYCMQLTDMNPRRAQTFMREGNPATWSTSMAGPNANKYYGFNINSIRKHGTAEFRYFPGGPDEAQLKDWMRYCQQVKSAALRTGLDGIINLESAAQVEQWVLAAFPEMGPALVADNSSEQMFDQLQEIAAMFPDEDVPDRRETVVFLSEPLLNYTAKVYLKSQFKADFLRRNLLPLKVVALNEWYDKLEDARAHVSDEERAAIEAKKAEMKRRRGVRGKEVTFEQFSLRHWNRDDLDDVEGFARFLQNHKGTLIDMYRQHIRTMQVDHPNMVCEPYAEADYERLTQNPQPRFQAEVEAPPVPRPLPRVTQQGRFNVPPPVDYAQYRDLIQRVADRNQANPWGHPEPAPDPFADDNNQF